MLIVFGNITTYKKQIVFKLEDDTMGNFNLKLFTEHRVKTMMMSID